MPWVYILKGKFKKKKQTRYYIGYALKSVENRLEAHRGEKAGGALFTSFMKDLGIVYREYCTTQKQAMRREIELKKKFKKMTRQEKESFIEANQ